MTTLSLTGEGHEESRGPAAAAGEVEVALRKIFFVIKHQNGLPRVESPSLKCCRNSWTLQSVPWAGPRVGTVISEVFPVQLVL